MRRRGFEKPGKAWEEISPSCDSVYPSEPLWLPWNGDSFWSLFGAVPAHLLSCSGSFWSGGSSSELLWLPLERRLPLESLLLPCVEPIWLLLELKRLLFGAVPAPSGAEALLRRPSGSLWSGDSLWSLSGSSGAEDLLERRLFFGAFWLPFGAETPSGAPLALLEPLERRLLLEPLFLALLERRLFFRAPSSEPLWLFWSGGSHWSPSGSAGAEALLWSSFSSLWSGDSI